MLRGTPPQESMEVSKHQVERFTGFEGKEHFALVYFDWLFKIEQQTFLPSRTDLHREEHRCLLIVR